MALLTQSSLDAIVTFFALNRLGWAVLFLSTRLSAPAYVSLMKLAKTSSIIAAPTYSTVVTEMRDSIDCTGFPIINSTDYRAVYNVPKYHRSCDKLKESRKICWIIHSSGSTGFPKPIFISNHGCLANFQKGLGFRSFTVSPLFHSHALMEFGRAIYAKRPIYFGNYAFPVTSQNLLKAMRVAQPEMVCAVPYVLKLLAEKEEGIFELTKAKIVMYGGSACPDALGDELTSKGVRLAGNYGATETGFIMNSFRPSEDKEWSYLRLHRPVADFVLMDEISPGVFECVALDGLPSKDTTNSDDPPNSFRTRDIFTRHPDPAKANYWKYLGRLDDRLTLVNGEKVLPIPIEGHIRQHPLVNEVAVFGVQRSLPGAIIFRAACAAKLTDNDYIDQIWPQIEAANGQAETFSQISRDLLVVRPADELYPKTDKGTIIRAQIYDKYAQLIDEAYHDYESGRSNARSTTPALQLNVPDLTNFLMLRFKQDLGVSLASPASDIFSAGVDSLQTMHIWNLIKKEIDLGGNQANLSQNVVFECGNVQSLAEHLYNTRLGITDETIDQADEVQAMQAMIDKYSTFRPHNPIGKPELPITGKTILLTGVTGGLGSILLARLLKRDDVAQVYTLVRATSDGLAHARVIDSLSTRNLIHDLSVSDVKKLTAVSGDLSLPSLGLSVQCLSNLLANVTHIIHSAWAVNFNIPLQAFEQQHICGVYNLIEHLALRTTHSKPAAFYFCSSISAASGTPKPATIQETQIEALAHAQAMGYGRSKLVAERITHAAMSTTGMQSRVLRIGQLAGDSTNAVWNDTEAIALMIRSALPTSSGCLPALDETPSWLPIDEAASTIEQLTLDQEQQATELVYHVLNPHTFSFEHDLLPMLAQHTAMPAFDIVPVEEWLRRLQSSSDDLHANPSKKLLGFWLKKYATKKASTTEESSQGLTFQTTSTQQDSSVLRHVRDPVSSGLMSRIVEVWSSKWN